MDVAAVDLVGGSDAFGDDAVYEAGGHHAGSDEADVVHGRGRVQFRREVGWNDMDQRFGMGRTKEQS